MKKAVLVSVFLLLCGLGTAAAQPVQQKTPVNPAKTYKVTWGLETGPTITEQPDNFVLCIDGSCTVLGGGGSLRETVLPPAATAEGPNGTTAVHDVLLKSCKVYPELGDECLQQPDTLLAWVIKVSHGRPINVTLVQVP